MNNREWLESLTDKQLSHFVTFGLYVTPINYPNGKYCISIHDIGRRSTQSDTGIEEWLKETQEYQSIDEENE